MGLPGPKTTLTLQTNTETNGAYGLATTWASEGTITGVLTKHSGVRLSYKETKEMGKPTVIAAYTFFCDYPQLTVTEKKRFILNTRTFEILNVYDPGGMHHHLEIELQEIF